MWEKWTKFCEWNIEDYQEHPKRRAAILAGMTIGSVLVVRKIARAAQADHEYYLQSRGVNIHN